MKYKLSDHCIATLVWLAVVLAIGSVTALRSTPVTALAGFGVLALATLNLLHARYAADFAGRPFADRVRQVVCDELAEMDGKITECQRGVEDVKEAQINIAGKFRGAAARSYP